MGMTNAKAVDILMELLDYGQKNRLVGGRGSGKSMAQLTVTYALCKAICVLDGTPNKVDMPSDQAAYVLRQLVTSNVVYLPLKMTTAIDVAIRALEGIDRKCSTCARFKDKNRRTCKVCRNHNLYK